MGCEHSNSVIGALIGLARATDGNEHLICPEATEVIVDCLAASREFLPEEKANAFLQRIDEQKRRMIPDCFACAAPCGKNNAFDMQRLREEEPQTRALKQQLLAGIQKLALCPDKATERFFYKALVVIGIGGLGPEHLEPVIQEMQKL